jgi:hypothetical protein
MFQVVSLGKAHLNYHQIKLAGSFATENRFQAEAC